MSETPQNTENNGWQKWSIFVIRSIETLSDSIADLNQTITYLKENDIYPLKVKMGVISIMGGLLGGAIMAVIIALIQSLGTT